MKTIRTLLLAILTLGIALPAQAQSPIIWGSSGQAKALNTGTITFKNGSTLSDYLEPSVIVNGSAEDPVLTNWAVDGNHTITRVTTGSPLSPVTPSAIQITGSSNSTESSTSGAYYSIATLPPVFLNTKLKVQFYVTTPASGTVNLSVYAGATRLSLSTDASGVTALPSGYTGKFTAYFDTTSATAYSVNLTRTVGGGPVITYVTGLVVGPGIQPQGAIVGPLQSFVPALTAASGSVSIGTGGNAYAQGYQRRNGQNMELSFSYHWGNTGTSFGSSGDYRFTVPSSLTADASVLASRAGSEYVVLGEGYFYDSSAVDYYPIAAIYLASQGTIIFALTTSLTGANLGPTNPVTVANDDLISVRMSIPIAEWSGSGTTNLAQNDVEYASNSSTTNSADTTSFAYGPNGSLVPTITAAAGVTRADKTVRFPTPTQASDSFSLEFQSSGTGSWLPIALQNAYVTFQQIGTSRFGVGIITSTLGSTDVTVAFAYGGATQAGGTYAATGSSYPSNAGDRWRVVKSKSGQAVGYGAATQTSLGLVKAGQVPGTNTNDNAVAGNIGEVVRSYVAATNTAATAAYDDLTSITLTAGDWDISLFAYFRVNGATATVWSAGISTTAGNFNTGLTDGDNFTDALAGTAIYNPSIVVPPYRVQPATTTTYYFKRRAVFTVGTPQIGGRITARRVR